jgi:hypothetical protein
MSKNGVILRGLGVFRRTAVNNNKTNQTRFNAKGTSYRTKQSSDNPNEILA